MLDKKDILHPLPSLPLERYHLQAAAASAALGAAAAAAAAAASSTDPLVAPSTLLFLSLLLSLRFRDHHRCPPGEHVYVRSSCSEFSGSKQNKNISSSALPLSRNKNVFIVCVCVAPLFAYSASLTVSMNLVRRMTRADVQRQLTVSAGRTRRLSSLSAQARQRFVCFFSNIISTKYSLVLHGRRFIGTNN